MKILGISGSLRTGSYNTALLEIARQVAPAGTEMTVADLSEITAYNLDVYKQGFPPFVAVFREQISAADCLLIATPEYNYGMLGVLKNAIDWASGPPDQLFDGKPMALLGASVGKLGTALAQNRLRQALVGLNG